MYKKVIVSASNSKKAASKEELDELNKFIGKEFPPIRFEQLDAACSIAKQLEDGKLPAIDAPDVIIKYSDVTEYYVGDSIEDYEMIAIRNFFKNEHPDVVWSIWCRYLTLNLFIKSKIILDWVNEPLCNWSDAPLYEDPDEDPDPSYTEPFYCDDKVECLARAICAIPMIGGTLPAEENVLAAAKIVWYNM